MDSCILKTRKCMRVSILYSQMHVNMQWNNTKIFSVTTTKKGIWIVCNIKGQLGAVGSVRAGPPCHPATETCRTLALPLPVTLCFSTRGSLCRWRNKFVLWRALYFRLAMGFVFKLALLLSELCGRKRTKGLRSPFHFNVKPYISSTFVR